MLATVTEVCWLRVGQIQKLTKSGIRIQGYHLFIFERKRKRNIREVQFSKSVRCIRHWCVVFRLKKRKKRLCRVHYAFTFRRTVRTEN